MEELMLRINQAFDNHKLIGNYDFSDDDYESMLQYVQDISSRSINRLSAKILFATLVEIAKRWKQVDAENTEKENPGYWEYVFKVLFDSGFNQTLYQRYTGLIRSLGEIQHIPIVASGHRYYSTIMMHAFAPVDSLNSFFDLCYNVFQKDLDYSFTVDDEWLCLIIILQMRNVLSRRYQENEVVSIGSSAYSIKAGLRSYVLDETLQTDFKEFTINVFRDINKLFNRELIEEKTRTQHLLKEWWNNKIKQESIEKEDFIRRKIPTVSKQNIAAKYYRDNDKVLLCVPSIRINNINDRIRLEIYVDGEIFSVQDIRTRRGELVVSTVPVEIELNRIFAAGDTTKINIEIKIFENDNLIFDSGKNKSTSLVRQFILFENENEVFSKINKPGNYFVYSKDIDGLKSIPDDLHTYGLNLYNTYPGAGESVKGEVREVLFIDKTKAPIGTAICLIGDIPDVEWVLEDISCSVFKSMIKLLVPKSYNLNALELKIDGKHYKLSILDYEDSELVYQFGLKSLELFSDQYPTSVSLYCFEREKEVFSEDIILLPNLEIKFNRRFYYGDVERKIMIGNETANVELTWANQENEITYPYNEGFLVIKVPYFKWRLNQKEWHNEPIIGKRWYIDFIENGDLLEIDFPGGSEGISVYGKIAKNKFEVPRNGQDVFEIGRSVYTRENETGISFFMSVYNEEFKLFDVATKEHFTENPIKYNNGSVFWNVENTFIGNRDKTFLLDIGGKGIYREKIDGENKMILSDLKENVYRVTVKIENDNIFSTGWETIFEGQLVAGDSEKFKFKNKRIVLLRGKCYGESASWVRFIPEYFIDNIEFVPDEENYYYKGQLCVTDPDGRKIVLNNMKNEADGYDKINPVRIELRNNSILWLVAGYKGGNDFHGELFMDKKRKGICNIQLDNELFGQLRLYRFKIEENV